MTYATLPFEVPGVTAARRRDDGTPEPVMVDQLSEPDDESTRSEPSIDPARARPEPGGERQSKPPPAATAPNVSSHKAADGRAESRKASSRRRRQPTKLGRRALQAVHKVLEHVHNDPEQLEAATHGEGPLLIFAGPGTGKTRTLTTRIAFLAESGIARLQEIVAVTFTVAAAAEMRVRLIELLGPERADWATVCTFHSLCHRIVRAHPEEFGRDSDFDVADPPQLRKMARAIIADPRTEELARALEEARQEGDEDPVEEVLRRISAAKNRMWTVEDLLEQPEERGTALTAALWRELDQQLRDTNLFDFDDLLLCTASLLEKHESLREHYREQYRWMLIDEFQDTNVIQLAIVIHLMAPDGNLTVVGDDDQSLYGFRQAQPANIINFAQLFPTAKTIKLERNYRCRQEILDAASALITNNQVRVPKTLISMRGPGAYTDVRFYPTEHEEAAGIGGLIEEDLAHGRDPTQILVLCRNASPLIFCQARLEEHGIKVRLIGGQSLWERTEICDAIAYLSLLANPYDLEAFERAVKAPSDRKPFSHGDVRAPTRGIDERLAHVVQFAKVNRINLIEASLRANEIGGVPTKAVAPLRELAAGLDRIHRAASPRGRDRMSVGEIVDRTVRMPGGPLDTYTMLRDHARSRSVVEDAKRVVEDLHSLARAAGSYEENAVELFPTLPGFIDSLSVDEDHELHYGEDDRVGMVTMHKAKGLEAQTVFCIAVEEGLIPDFRSTHEADKLEDERRLLYTAASRAMDNLLITHVGTRGGRSTGGPSQFLPETRLL